MFGFQAIINETFLHRDAGLGYAWRCPLPNGYSILMIDETHYGWVFNTKTQPGAAIGEQDDAVSGIDLLELSGNYVLGKRNEAWAARETSGKASYFIMDATKGTHTAFPNEMDLEAAAAKPGVASIHLEPIDVVYRRYRFTWFDRFAAFLFFVPPFAGLVALGVWVMGVRKTGRSTQAATGLHSDRLQASVRGGGKGCGRWLRGRQVRRCVRRGGISTVRERASRCCRAADQFPSPVESNPLNRRAE